MNDDSAMNSGNKQPAGFFLRADFALELGFADQLREPISEQAYAKLCREQRNRVFCWSEFAAENRRRAAYTLPDYMGYCFLLPPKETMPVPFVTDGTTWRRVELEGLFEDFVRRVQAVTTIAEVEELPIMPDNEGPDRNGWRFPEVIAFHSCKHSRVDLMPAECASKLLLDQHD